MKINPQLQQSVFGCCRIFHNAFFVATLICGVMAQSSRASDALADLSLEQLASLRVTSVSKKPKPWANEPASVFVITEQDIRRTGSTTLPEALRLAPNLQVARVDARNYAITARGFNNPFANKLLVLIDGRSVYSPLFSGVYWDAQDVVLEDLDRIEVISGPGGSLWGANAVNGVVNVVTRSAEDTQGELVSLGGSVHEQQAAVRHGGQLTNEGFYRVYAKHSRHDDTENAAGALTYTGWERSQAGFRADWAGYDDHFTLQGDAYRGRLHQSGTEDIKISGANILGRASRQFAPGSRLTFQAYVDHTQRDQPNAFVQHLNTIDLELQHECLIGERQMFMWGGGYRYLSDRIDNDVFFAFLPDDLNMQWRNVFIQDEIKITRDLRLTLGAKWEDNPFTGWESMPSAQLAWSPGHNQLLWGKVSRAVRTPSRIDRDYYSPANPPLVDGEPRYVIAGGPGFVSEVADVYEVGYRQQPVAQVSWSVTGFYSEYDQLRTLELNNTATGFVFENRAAADAYGLELWGSWQPLHHWRLHASLVAQEFDVYLKPGSTDISNTTALASYDPNFYSSLRSSYDVSPQVTLDSTLRYVDELKGSQVPAYTALDVRVAWEISRHLEISLVGQNLIDRAHPEFGASPRRSEYERALYGKLIWEL
ncbi:MAG TPA: TonB-dependent receptor [Cellvibrio sp.]|nr:TonB-dependent receptor [Cellvibrio sp.]